jgi:hypothetical protein
MRGGIIAALIAVFIGLTSPKGSQIYVAPDQVIAVFSNPGVGAAPTEVLTQYGPLYVQESPETVIARMRDAPHASRPNESDH